VAGTAAQAEVAAVLAEDGRYLRTEVRTVQRGRVSSVWLSSDSRIQRGSQVSFQRVLLNETGADRADGLPSIANHPLTGLPWAVWAFNESGDYELAVSVFDGRNWSSPILLGAAPNGAADLEPRLLFTTTGRPLISWWRMSADGAEQSVWFTTRINGAWQPAMRLSSSRRLALRPSMQLTKDGLIVAYETELGIEIRTFPLNAPMLGGSQPAGGADGPDPPSQKDTRPPECQLIGCIGN
jgi:hypothetical protein